MLKLLKFARPSRLTRGLLTRRGSVLIMCVVLIVILALIGTAMLTTARIDRGSAIQHSYNTQVDLLIEGARNIAKSVILSDLYGITPNGQVLRPVNEQSSVTPAYTYEHWDAPMMDTSATPPLQNDRWIGSLAPHMLVDDVPAPVSPVYWPAITGPLVSGNFEDPTSGAIPDPQPQVYMAPTVRRITNADGSVESYPGLVSVTSGAQPYLGADADGDGIADSLLCRMLPGELNGVSYYVAVRIVDNAAKVNVNTAWSQENDFALGSVPVAMFNDTNLGAGFAGNLGIFGSHVGLFELLNVESLGVPPRTDPTARAEMQAVNRYRFGWPTNQIQPAFPASLDPVEDGAGTFTPRTDYTFVTQGDALQHTLTNRFRNPSYNLANPTTGLPYRPFSESDAASLASRFTLLNLNASPTTLEDTFFQAFTLKPGGAVTDPDSLYRSAGNYPGSTSRIAGFKNYQPDQVVLWYDQNFNFDRAVGPVSVVGSTPTGNLTLDNSVAPYARPIRSLITPSNPVSLLTAAHDMNLAAPRGIAVARRTADQLAEWQKMPDYNGMASGPARSPAKTDVNTARFGELWSAYWNVMVDQSPAGAGDPRNGTPFVIPTGLVTDYVHLTYYGNYFDSDTWQPVPAPITAISGHPAQMFRSPLREMRQEVDVGIGIYMDPDQVMLLRAALAAVNTEDLRDSDTIPTMRTIDLDVHLDGGAITTSVDIYGTEPQPFITEVYVNNATTDWGGGRNTKGYVAIELYNPYPVAIDLSNWTLAVVDRRYTSEAAPSPGPQQPGANPYPSSTGSGQAGLSYFYIHNGSQETTDGAGVFPCTPLSGTIPAHSFLVLHNLPGPTGGGNPAEDAQYFPSTTGLAAPAGAVFVANLHWVLRDENPTAVAFKEGRGGELVLLRPVDPTAPARLETRNGAPVDSFDFTGMTSAAREAEYAGGAPADATPFAWHYLRSTGATANQPNWKFVYPGRYLAFDTEKRRQQGTHESGGWNAQGGEEDPYLATVVATLGGPNPDDESVHTPTRHTIQLFEGAGPNPVGTVPNRFPFGGFMRNGDILQVPFIGSYVVRLPRSDPAEPLSSLEINAITIDSAFANDTDTANDEDPNFAGTPQVESTEQVGRFLPLRILDNDGDSVYNDLDPDGDFDRLSTDTANKWRYRWAIDLFDYLTVGSPGNDYAPNVPTNQTTPYTPERKPVDNDGDGVFGDIDVATATAQNAPNLEDTVPVHGLININTAPWRVLAAIPWVRYGDDYYNFDESTGLFSGTIANPLGNGVDDNIDIAKAIVSWRDGNPAVTSAGIAARTASGPFKSIFDLYRVHDNPPQQQDRVYILSRIQDNLAEAGDPDDAQGDFSPINTTGTPAPDGVREDFEEQFLVLNRISNLITTRSDSFTVYIQVQGWVGVGSPAARMVVQRRAAFIMDRSGITVNPTSASDVGITPVPTD